MRELKIILILTIGSVFACKKVETPPSSANNPIFGITANLGSDSLKIDAGKADYYLFTSFETDANNVRSFVGTFAKIDCLDECQDTFRIKIRDAQALPQNSGNINDALFVGSYDFKNNDPAFSVEIDTIYSYSATFNASASIISNSGNTEYNWTIGGEEFMENNPIFPYEFDNQPNEILPVKLTLKSGGIETVQSANLAFSMDSLEKVCFTQIAMQPASGALSAFLIGGQQPLSYQWSDGSTFSSIQQPDTLFYSVTVTDVNGCQGISSISLENPNNGVIASQAMFSVAATADFEEIPDTTFISDPLQLSTVTIEYVDENGVFYSSELDNQPANAAFQILSVDDFDNNENGEKTKQLEVEFNCILGSEAALPSLQLTDGRGKIAVAYPD